MQKSCLTPILLYFMSKEPDFVGVVCRFPEDQSFSDFSLIFVLVLVSGHFQKVRNSRDQPVLSAHNRFSKEPIFICFFWYFTLSLVQKHIYTHITHNLFQFLHLILQNVKDSTVRQIENYVFTLTR